MKELIGLLGALYPNSHLSQLTVNELSVKSCSKFLTS